MKRHSVLILAPFFLFQAACSTQVKPLSEKEINAKADSMVNERKAEINRQAMEDLEQRTAIEVKAKADSIVSLRLGEIRPDTIGQPRPAQDEESMNFNRERRRRNDSLK